MASQHAVWLGLAGDLVGQADPVDHYATKVGGAPWYPGAAAPAEGERLRCGACDGSLSLVLQVLCFAVVVLCVCYSL
jgi:hypothetical protein